MIRRLFVLCLAGTAGCAVQRQLPQSAAATDDHMAQMSAADMNPPESVRGSMPAGWQGTPGLPASNASAPARLAASPRHAEWVKFPSAPGSPDSIMAWLVYPVSQTKAPVVVIIHEIFGLSTWARSVADQAAAEGFIAIAPDFLSRVRGGPSTEELPSQTATQMIRGVDAAEKNRIVTAAANYAMMLPAATQKYGIMGFCWGGSTSWGYAINEGVSGFSAAVAFYGTPYTSGGSPATATQAAVPATIDSDSLAKIRVPVRLFSGSRDARISAAMPDIETQMKRLGKDYVGINYDGAIHGFMRAQDDPTNAANEGTRTPNLTAAKDAWPKAIAFLKKNLGVM